MGAGYFRGRVLFQCLLITVIIISAREVMQLLWYVAVSLLAWLLYKLWISLCEILGMMCKVRLI